MLTRRFLLGSTASALAFGASPLRTARAQAFSFPQAPELSDVVAPGFARSVIIRWGDPVLPNAPPFTPDSPSETAAAGQFGWDGVIAGIVRQPLGEDGVPRFVMVVSHPDVRAELAFPGGAPHPAIAGKMQGASVLNLSYRGERWVVVDGGYQSRRITDGTLCRISGPIAPVIGGTVQGLLAPQIGCTTPWNTVLLPEGHVSDWLRRLRHVEGFGDPAIGPRFGWVAELDAMDPTSFPVKRTALGRFPRAAVACGLANDGSPVVLMTENAPMGRLFRFKGMPNAARTGDTALDDGSLAVARIEGDGITWVDLPNQVSSYTATQSAADGAGSGFDYPAGMAIGPGLLYLACSGNRQRRPDQVDALNPRAGNGGGHVIAFTPPGGDLGARRFAGQVVLLGGDPDDPTVQYQPGSSGWLRAPRTLMLDREQRLWIGTDQGGVPSPTADGLFVVRTQGSGAYAVDPVYLAPVGGAIGGSVFEPDGHALFTMARHPGAAPGSTFGHPVTRWPTMRPDMPPQTTMVSLTRGF